MFTNNGLDFDKIAENYVFWVEGTHLDSWVDFLERFENFVGSQHNLAGRHVFTIAFLFNVKELEQQLYSVHCIGSGLQYSRCKIVESNVPSNFLKLQGNL